MVILKGCVYVCDFVSFDNVLDIFWVVTTGLGDVSGIPWVEAMGAAKPHNTQDSPTTKNYLLSYVAQTVVLLWRNLVIENVSL